jgi:uncharacterized protein (DUF433 family)
MAKLTHLVNLYAGNDPRAMPTYSIPEAAHYLRIPEATLRSWVIGRDYQTKGGARRFAPVINVPDKKLRLLSFLNVVEAHVLNAIRRHHSVPLHKVRKALDYIQKEFPARHPLASQEFMTDGVDLFIEKWGQLINVSRDGQLAMKSLLQAYLRRIEREGGAAVRLYPFTAKTNPARVAVEEAPKPVVIDPFVSFGRPVLSGTGLPTAVLAERWDAGDSIDELAEDYGRTKAQIEEAIRYERAA